MNFFESRLIASARDTLVRGGRMVKCKGVVVACAPHMGVAAVGLFLLVGAAGQARAVNECGPAGGVVVCDVADATYPSYSLISYTNIATPMTLFLNDPAITVTGGPVEVIGNSSNAGAISVIGTQFQSIIRTTTAPFALGLRAQTAGTGATLAQMDTGLISTAGPNGYAIASYITNPNSTATAISRMNGGTITTSGTAGTALWAWNAGNGDVLTEMNGGRVILSGNFLNGGTNGMFSHAAKPNNRATATARMTGGYLESTGDLAIDLYSGGGLFALNSGLGRAVVEVSGDSRIIASGLNSNGIRAQVLYAGASYAVSVSDTAFITGGSGSGTGIYTASVAGTSGTIDIGAGAIIDGATNGGRAIVDEGGNVTVTVAGTVSGRTISLGDGSDVLRIGATADISGISIALDGGDNTGISDTWIDDLTLTGQALNRSGSFLLNWENVTVDGGSLAINDGALAVGADIGMGLTLTNGGVLDAGDSLVLTGNLNTANGGTLDATGSGVGIYSIDGGVRNNGAITTQDSAIGDVVTVTGNYAGAGLLLLDVDTAVDAADRLTIEGDVTGGTTAVRVANVSAGAASGNDITLVSVDGTTTDADFTLDDGPLTAGAFDYNLERMGADWILAAAVNSTGAVYEAAPSVLLSGFASLPTLERRIGQRQWVLRGGGGVEGVWMRMQGERTDITPRVSDSAASWSNSSWGLQLGADFFAHETKSGYWVLGVTGQHGRMGADVSNPLGQGRVSGSSFGLGATATWHGYAGTYVDFQGQANWISADYSTSAHGSMASDRRATAYALSAELGHRLTLDSARKHALVPQAQLSHGQVNGGRFTDNQGNDVTMGTIDRTLGRIGLAYEYRPSGLTEGQRANDKQMVYGVLNILHDFSSTSSVGVAGAALQSRGLRTWGEIGVGGSLAVAPNATLYGEASYRRALSSGTSGNSGLQGSAGLRLQW